MDHLTRNAVFAMIAALVGLAAIIGITLNHAPRTAARLFPDAVEVRAFAWSYGPNDIEQVVPEGVVLTAADIAELRTAIYWTTAPEAIVGCCIPRHEFKFYDAARQELGSVEVCFECHCANISGEAASNPEHPWLDWNEGPVARILRRHKLPIDL
jgi:hypothetical protein